RVPAARLRLPVGPVVGQVVVGTAHLQLAQAAIADPQRLSDGVAILDVVGVFVPVVRRGGIADGIRGRETAAGHAHGPDPAPVRGVQADADLVEQDRVGGAVGTGGEAGGVVDAEGAAAAVVAALEADGVGVTGERIVEPAGAAVGRVIAPRPAAAIQREGDVAARIGGAEVDGDGVAADAPPALVAA